MEKFETTPSTKIRIPGQATINIPMTGSNWHDVIFETTVILEQNNQTMKALSDAKANPAKVNYLFNLDAGSDVKVEGKVKIMTESEKTMNRLVNELERLNVYNSSTQQIQAFCNPAIEQLENILKTENDVLVIERAEKQIEVVKEMRNDAPQI